MFAQSFVRLAFLLLIGLVVRASGSTTELTLAKTQEGFAGARITQSYDLVLDAGDYVCIRFDPHGKELTLISYDPSGVKVRGARLGPAPDDFDFVAASRGNYRLEVAGPANVTETSFAITLAKIVSLEARLTPAKPLYVSPRIGALKTALETGQLRNVNSFWNEIETQGAPIIEPLSGDDKNLLVTFFWKGTRDTHNVFVLRFPYAGIAPGEYFMDHVENTDVWFKTVSIDRKARFEYSLAPNVPRIRPVSQGIDQDAINMIAAAARPDPLNPKRWRVEPQNPDSLRYERSIVEMPDAPPQPWLAEHGGIRVGRIEKRRIKSQLLKNEREIAVYLPPGYSRDAKPYPLLVVFDEIDYLGDPKQIVLVPTPTILNNLISAKRVPPMVALLIDNVPDGRDRELACNPLFSDFLSSELVPWAHSLYNFTADPRKIVVTGSSLGGVAAACAALRHPESFGNVLSQSGAFHWQQPKDDQTPGSGMNAEPNWIARQFIASPKLPLSFYLDAGSDEFDASGDNRSILVTNRTLRDVLLAKGYEVHFREFAGGHDYLSWRGLLAEGLITLIGLPQAGSGQELH